MEIKYLEWNIRAMGGKGYEIPMFITDYLKIADIFVLVEFCASNGWAEFKNKLEKDFDLYCSPFVSQGYNQVCIGLRKKIKYELLSVETKDVCNVNIPEFLQVDIEIESKKISIIGTRIKTQGGTKLIQYDYLKKHLKHIDKFLCLGDFNCVHSELSKMFSEVASVYGPRIVNGYQDTKFTPVATYDWSFVTESNGYMHKTAYDYLGINGLPDHAILKGMVKI